MDEEKKRNDRDLTVLGGIIAGAVVLGQLGTRGKLFAGVSNKVAALFWGLVETALFAVGILIVCGFLGSMFAKLFENFEEASTGAKIGKVVLLIVCVIVFGEAIAPLCL